MRLSVRQVDRIRSEEHTSELQSHSFISYAVFCLKKQGAKSFYAGKYALWAHALSIGDTVWERPNSQDPEFGMRSVAPFPVGSKNLFFYLGPAPNLLTFFPNTPVSQ